MENHLFAWGHRLSILEPWPNLQGRPHVVNAVVTSWKPDLPHLGAKPRFSWFLWPLFRSLQLTIQSLKKKVNSFWTGNFKQLTVKEALLNGSVATQGWMWFYVSKIIGKCGIIGYNVWGSVFNTCLVLVYYLNAFGPWVIRVIFQF